MIKENCVESRHVHLLAAFVKLKWNAGLCTAALSGHRILDGFVNDLRLKRP
jgi:hypothetical protein